MDKQNDWSKVQELAQVATDNMEHKTRTATGEDYVCRKDGAPDWLADLCQHAHGDAMPDDWKYLFIESTFDRILNYSSLRDFESDALECDPYFHDLARWIGSNTNRSAYVDRYVEKNGYSDYWDVIGESQILEKYEVQSAVLLFLSGLGTDDDDNTDDEN